MAREYQISIVGHPSIYKPKERMLNVYYSEPENGINKQTGILLLIPGFGGYSKSNVYRKMRSLFSDKYNLVTVQCDFFGYEFLQNVDFFINNYGIELSIENSWVPYSSELIKNIFKYLISINSNSMIIDGRVKDFRETPEYCNDMCVMQALDNITAVIKVIQTIKENGYEFNKDKIILYGTSHGSYLSYICNAFAPFLFSLLIDNSSYIFPMFLKKRTTYTVYTEQNYGLRVQLNITFNHIINKIFNDKEILYLPSLYNKFMNKCNIISFHGADDELTSSLKKRKFCNLINNCIYQEISNANIDHQLFKSTYHNTDVNLIDLFDIIIKNFNFKERYFNIEKGVVISTKKYKYTFDFLELIPKLYIK